MAARLKRRPTGSDSEDSTDSDGLMDSVREFEGSSQGQSASEVNSPMGAAGETTQDSEEEDLKEYAKSLGLDLDADPDLAWIAREAFVLPLPVNWTEHADGDSGKVYFFNQVTQESDWSHPTDHVFKEILVLVKALRAEQPPASDDRRLQAIQEHIASAHAIALERLDGWSGPYDSDAGAYFYNTVHETSTWDNPVDELEQELALRQRILHGGLLRDGYQASQAVSSSAPVPSHSGGYSNGGAPVTEVVMPQLPLGLRLTGSHLSEDGTPASPSSARSFCTARSGGSARSGRSPTPPPRLHASYSSFSSGAASPQRSPATESPRRSVATQSPRRSPVADRSTAEMLSDASPPLSPPTAKNLSAELDSPLTATAGRADGGMDSPLTGKASASPDCAIDSPLTRKAIVSPDYAFDSPLTPAKPIDLVEQSQSTGVLRLDAPAVASRKEAVALPMGAEQHDVQPVEQQEGLIAGFGLARGSASRSNSKHTDELDSARADEDEFQDAPTTTMACNVREAVEAAAMPTPVRLPDDEALPAPPRLPDLPEPCMPRLPDLPEPCAPQLPDLPEPCSSPWEPPLRDAAEAALPQRRAKGQRPRSAKKVPEPPLATECKAAVAQTPADDGDHEITFGSSNKLQLPQFGK